MNSTAEGADILPEFPLPAYRNLSQAVSLPVEEGQCAEDLVASTVRILPATCLQKKPSSKLTLKSDVDYSWEDKFYAGQMVAVNSSASLVAYAITADPKTRDGGVRVLSKKNGGRGLIKGMKGPIKDLAFSKLDSPTMLGVVDESANLFVYQIKLEGSTVMGVLTMHIVHEVMPASSISMRVVWVPFIADDDDDECENSRLVALIMGSTVEVWQIDQVTAVFGCCPVNPDDVVDGLMIVRDHADEIVEALFSPDGSALATASLDGTQQFFQLYPHSGKPVSLHTWQPHDGKPLSFLGFLDDHKHVTSESKFWNFMVTGANNNTELKIHRCTDWKTLQTISIQNSAHDLRLKVAIDESASFIFLSDQYNEIVYLFKVQLHPEIAHVKCVSAYLVPFSILSFAIVDVSSQYLKADDCDEDLSDSEDDEAESITTMSLYLMHSKSLQECKIQLVLPPPGEQLPLSTLAPDQPELPPPFTLMTPKELTSPAAKPQENQTEPIVLKTEPVELATSGASSPSQEVRDILSLTDVTEVAKLYPAEPEVVLEKRVKTENKTPEVAPAVDWSQIARPDQQRHSLSPRVYARESLSKTKTSVEIIEQSANGGDTQAQEEINKKLDDILAQLKELKVMQQKTPKREKTSPAVERSMEALSAQLTEQMRKKEAADRDRQEAVMSTISQAVENLLAVKLEEVVPLEFRKNVLPAILSDFEPFKRTLHIEMTQQLSATDHLLKENISKLVNSKSVMDVLASALTSSTRNAFSGSCKELMNSFLLPRLEKILEKTFLQVHETFTGGIRECMNGMRSDVDKVLGEMKRAEAGLKHATESKKGAIALIVNQTEASLLSAAEKINNQIAETIQREIKLARLSVDANPASRAITPAVLMHERQTRISQLMAAGQFNSAFQEALSASDLNMVVYICERISAEQLFKSPTSPLQQPVLLSLIQQVTADLSKNTELKCSYLTEAVLRLEPNHPTTSEHLPVVIAEVERNISNYLQTHPNTKSAIDLNRTVMVLKILREGRRT